MPALPLIFADASPIDNLRDIGTQTGFSLQHVLSQAIAFLIVAWVLKKFAYGPVMIILEQRRKAIEESLANADRIKKELAEATADRAGIIKKANEQAQAIIAEAQAAANTVADRRAQEASAQAEEIIRKAHEASVLERDRLMTELKREVGALVIETTRKVAGKVLTSDDQARLTSETVSQLNAAQN